MEMEMVKVEWHLSVGLVGCEKSGTEEVEKDYWDSLDLDEREDFLKEIVFEEIEWGYEELE